MRRPDVPEGIDPDKVETIKQSVELDDLIRDSYDYLWQELVPQLGRRYMRLPSPFRSSGDSSKSVLIFSNDMAWHWADPLTPSHIPRNVIGFVMAFEQCSYEHAIGKLWQVVTRFRGYRAMDGMHLRIVGPSADDIFLAELHHTRERIATIGGLHPDEMDQLVTEGYRGPKPSQ